MKIAGISMLLAVLFFMGPGSALVRAEMEGGAVDKPVIKVIYNNIVEKDRYKGKWGFSCVIEGMEKTILFDTGGDGRVLMKNMKRMGIDPRSIDIVILSHEHQDHIGGLEAFLKKNDDVMVFAPVSFSSGYKNLVKKRKIRNVDIKGPMQICRNVYTSGEMGREVIEHSLFLKTDLGTVVITGCAHPGIVSITEMALSISGRQPLLVMGGFHLARKSDDEVAEIIAMFRKLGVAYVGASHCTGEKAIELFRDQYGAQFVETGVGAVVEVWKLK